MFSQGSPWTPTRSSLELIDASLRDMLATLWNTFSFFTTYASLNGFEANDVDIPPPNERPAMDRWILSRVEAVTSEVTSALDGYEPLTASDSIARLVDDLSNWYVRRSRRRFWRTDPSAPRSDSMAAHATLLDALQRITLLLAPFCPFIADRLFRELFDAANDDSVHLADWPAPGKFERDEPLERSMDVARRLTTLGRAARADAGIKVRQPLRRALVFLPSTTPLPPSGVVEEELNVDLLEFSAELADVLDFELVPNFRTLGPRLGEAAKELRTALTTLDGASVAATLEAGESVELSLSTGIFLLGPEDVELRVRAQGGFAVSREGSEVVALDLELDDDLRRRGNLRELVRQVQDLRKSSGFDVSDRIELWVTGVDDLSDGFDSLAAEVLATSLHATAGSGDGTALLFDDDRTALAWVKRVGA